VTEHKETSMSQLQDLCKIKLPASLQDPRVPRWAALLRTELGIYRQARPGVTEWLLLTHEHMGTALRRARPIDILVDLEWMELGSGHPKPTSLGAPLVRWSLSKGRWELTVRGQEELLIALEYQGDTRKVVLPASEVIARPAANQDPAETAAKEDPIVASAPVVPAPASSPSAALTTASVGGIELEIVQGPSYSVPASDGFTVRQAQDARYVVVKRVCESLDVSHQDQHAKLCASSSQHGGWATVARCRTVAQDGKNREQFCLALACVPKWLSEIDRSRVKESARPAIDVIQAWTRDVLYLAASSQSVTTAVSASLEQQAADVVSALLRRVQEQTKEIAAKDGTIVIKDQKIAELEPKATAYDLVMSKGPVLFTVARQWAAPAMKMHAFRTWLVDLGWCVQTYDGWVGGADALRDGYVVDDVKYALAGRDGKMVKQAVRRVLFTALGIRRLVELRARS
jgi:P22_AR N-terminal domain